jgi:hypothetical protein
MRTRIHNAGVYCCIINVTLSWYQLKNSLPGTKVPIFWASERPAAAAVGGVGEGARGGILRLPHRRQETQGLPSVTSILRLIPQAFFILLLTWFHNIGWWALLGVQYSKRSCCSSFPATPGPVAFRASAPGRLVPTSLSLPRIPSGQPNQAADRFSPFRWVAGSLVKAPRSLKISSVNSIYNGTNFCTLRCMF